LKKTTTGILTIALAGLALSGCFSRVHLSKNYGRAYKQAFQRQAVNPPSAASSKTPKGLDALESSIVVDTYRKGLTPQGGAPAGNQMILVSPGSGQLGYAGSSAPAAPAK